MSYDEAKYFLNARDDIAQWTHVFEHFFLFVSDNDGESLGTAVLSYVQKNQGRQKPRGHFLVMEISADRQGWLPVIAWNMMNYQSTEAPKPVKSSVALAGGTDELEEEIPF
ncbi:MAG TPA: hypothetical protein VGU66_06190 [Candidatus Elarobacter sp.]|nr:hypothetical protein [Candidatus Elarobacter sp.]